LSKKKDKNRRRVIS